MKKLSSACLFFSMLVTTVMAQSKASVSVQLSGFKALLSNINGTFTFPDNFTEVKVPNNDKLPFQYGLKANDADFEIWLQVNSIKADWQRYEANKQLPNPDSSYIKTAADEALVMSGTKDYIIRPLPAYMLDRYNADSGRSYLLTLGDFPSSKRYQYGLIIVLHKNHYGNIVVACLTNEKGPAFFKNISQLRYCFKFNN